MNPTIISEMLTVLQPVVKNQKKAKELLERYWQTRMALIWTTDHIHRAANEVGVALKKSEASTILQDLHHHHNRQYGLRWSDVTSHIKEEVLGRELTKRELSKFVHHDIITIIR